eukprot:Clim_evm12s214 gene=Clim_evmTU12s214
MSFCLSMNIRSLFKSHCALYSIRSFVEHVPKEQKKKKVAKAPLAQTTKKVEKAANPLTESTPRNFGIGQNVQPTRDIGRYTKFPKYIRLQRQRAVLMKRLKVPPSLNQFTQTLDKNTATELFKVLNKYHPETKQAKKERLLAQAEAKVAKDTSDPAKKPYYVKCGLNHVTALIENKKAKLVVIAHDVDPIEMVVWLPALCRKMDVPYCIVKGKARLGQVVHKKTATCLAITEVRPEDKTALTKVVEGVREKFNEKYEDNRRRWGGHILGFKSTARQRKLEAIRAKELAARA